MAYIPDEAVDRLAELSKGARHLYVFLARCRNQKTGRCFPSVMTTKEALGVNRSSVFALRKELVEKGWATFDGDEVKQLLGFNSPEIQTAYAAKKADKSSPEIQTMAETQKADSPEIQTTFVDSIRSGNSPEIQTETDESRKSDLEVQKIRPGSPENQTAYKEEPAKEPANITSKEDFSGALAPVAISKDRAVELFEKYRISLGGYEAPYHWKNADYVQWERLLKRCRKANWTLTEERFLKALKHYLETPQGTHTLADLAVRFSDFFRTALDRFVKPAGADGGKDNAKTPTGDKESRREYFERAAERIKAPKVL